ncbi:MAG: DNA/RNA non-specific endonuclease [Flammeovirgaceae bacterium]
MNVFYSIVLCLMCTAVSAQTLEEQLQGLAGKLADLEAQKKVILAQAEDLKLQRIRRDLGNIGMPTTDYVAHAAMFIAYDEKHEQAKWVAHIITADIITGNVGRTNDFREDPKITTGSAVEADYFLKSEQPDGTVEYDGFGYDRGHLAPSADFRWSHKALSESYFYSNMSPQLPAFNRESWADLEALLRGYIFEHPETQLYVFTLPILSPELPVIERGVNKVSIPNKFVKVALDLKNQQGIAFVMPNQKNDEPLSSFAITIDEAEAQTGFDFYHLLADEQEAKIEAQLDKKRWFPALASGDVEPLIAPDLPKNHFNTTQAKYYLNKKDKIHVCGTVVSTRLSRKGNLWLNLDKKFPNQVFSAYIPKEHLVNFSYIPEKELLGKQVCIYGMVRNVNGTPTMKVFKENEISYFEERNK